MDNLRLNGFSEEDNETMEAILLNGKPPRDLRRLSVRPLRASC